MVALDRITAWRSLDIPHHLADDVVVSLAASVSDAIVHAATKVRCFDQQLADRTGRFADVLAAAPTRPDGRVRICSACSIESEEIADLSDALWSLDNAARATSSMATMLEHATRSDPVYVATSRTAFMHLFSVRRNLDLPLHTGGEPPWRRHGYGAGEVLGDWWPTQVTTWDAQLASVRSQWREHIGGFTGPLQMLSPLHSDPSEPWRPPSGRLGNFVAAADTVGVVTVPTGGKVLHLPVFAIPATVVVQDPWWVTLGPVRDDAAARETLFSAYGAALAADGPVRRELVGALVNATT